MQDSVQDRPGNNSNSDDSYTTSAWRCIAPPCRVNTITAGKGIPAKVGEPAVILKLLLLFTVVPLVELWLLIEIGRLIGAWPTVLIVASTGFAGVWLARSQGLLTLFQIRSDLEQGIVPGDKLLDGLCILLGGAFLITPGLLTDLFGFSLLLPFSRRWIKEAGRRFLERRLLYGALILRRRR